MADKDNRIVSRVGGFVSSAAYGPAVAAVFGDAIDDAAAKAERVLAGFSDTIDGIRRNPSLSATGKAQSADAAAKQAAADIAGALANKMAFVEQAITTARAAAPPQPPIPWRFTPQQRGEMEMTRGDELAMIEARAAEIRSALVNQMSPQDAWGSVVQALRLGDAEVAYAVSQAPPIVRGIIAPSAEQLEQEISAYMKAKFPNEAAVLDTAENAKRALVAVQQQSWSVIESIAAASGFTGIRVSGPDPLQRLTPDGYVKISA